MKSKFPGYFNLTSTEIKDLWDNALFALDANILLNLYRYSDDTKDGFIKIFEMLGERLWLPHQSAHEFFNNRLNQIGKQIKAYDDAVLSLETIETEFKNTRQHPFVSQELLKSFSDIIKKLHKELSTSKEFHNKRISKDDILSRLQKLFDGKVGEEFNEETLKSVLEEGKTRLTQKIPPGYMDAKKSKEEENDVRALGDLILWKQILDKAKQSESSVILITDDRKEDWWVKYKGKTLGPRPELIKEFKDETSKLFHMYSPDTFLRFAAEHFKEEVKTDAIKEVKELRKTDELISSTQREEKKIFTGQAWTRLMQERMHLMVRKDALTRKKDLIEDRVNEQKNLLNSSDPSAFDDRELRLLQSEMQLLELQKEKIDNSLNAMDNNLFKL